MAGPRDSATAAPRQVFQEMTERQARRIADPAEPATDDLVTVLADDPPPHAGEGGSPGAVPSNPAPSPQEVPG
jgi:hypothetical protein